MLATPLLREGVAIGVILIRRMEMRPFSDTQIALLQTFADQAVIAIENVRLFAELEARNRDLTEALDRQTATAAILQVISSSPTDVQPVLDAVAESAARLCGAHDALIHRVEGETMRLVAHFGALRYGAASETRPISAGSHSGQAILERRVVHVDDMLDEQSLSRYPDVVDLVRSSGARTLLAVPLLHDETPIGVIVIRRLEVRPFSDSQVELVKTFADQAVIAIENVRLFTELEARNWDLSEALEQQTATADILKVISSSPTDTQPVFDAIAANAAHLCSANEAQVLRVDGEVLRLVAAFGAPSMPSIRQLTRGHLVGRAVIDRTTIHVRDLAHALAEYPETTAGQFGVESALAVPLMRDGVALGVIRISRTEVRPFSDNQIALLQTFADQAVIAIENVRLFTELDARNRDLTEALEQQTATAEILRVISSSPTDVQPVFDAIAASSMRLCEGEQAVVTTFDGEVLQIAALANFDARGTEAMRQAFPHPAPSWQRARAGRAVERRRAHPVVLGRPGVHVRVPGPSDRLSRRPRRPDAQGWTSDRSHGGCPPRAQGHSPTGRSGCSRPSPPRP